MATSPTAPKPRARGRVHPVMLWRLAKSLEDARVLLWYATREGKQLPEDMVQTIVDAQSLLGLTTQNRLAS